MVSSHRKKQVIYRLICLDKCWVEFYIHVQRHKSRSWIEPEAKAEPIPGAELNEQKILLIVKMDIRGVATWKTYDKDITMMAERYKSFLADYETGYFLHPTGSGSNGFRGSNIRQNYFRAPISF